MQRRDHGKRPAKLSELKLEKQPGAEESFPILLTPGPEVSGDEVVRLGCGSIAARFPAFSQS